MGKAHTISTHRQYFRDKYSARIGKVFYGLSFIWKRVFPKLPWFKKIYFAVSGGRNRIVSRAEILGRLCFCGFEVLAEAEFGHRFYFIARKVKTPCTDSHPTYGPLVRLRRSGIGGQPITVYADMPETLEEIMESERRYIRRFLERPMRTQVR